MSLSGGQLSSGNSVAQRAENDFYATDPKAVTKLLECFERDDITIRGTEYLEPCVGTGNIRNVFKDDTNMNHWTCLDLVDRGCPNTVVQDFLSWQTSQEFDFIITNPPYSLAADFVKKSMEILSDNGMCCMFLKLQFLEGAKRKELFEKYPPRYIYVFRNSQVHFNLKNRVGEKDYTMNEEQWKRFRQGWESYGVKFQNDDGTYKYTEDVLNEMAIVWRNLGER